MSRPSLCILALVLTAVAHAETADLRIRFVYDGKAPARRQVMANGRPVLDEWFVVDTKTNGIRDVLMVAYIGVGGSNVTPTEHSPQTHRWQIQNSRLLPRFVLARAGDELQLVNRDAVVYYPSFNFVNNALWHLPLPADQAELITMEASEPVPIPVQCHVHPWVKGYLVVSHHPFVALSDKTGSVTIRGLPANKRFVFRLFHESGRFHTLSIDGQEVLLSRQRLELDLKPGLNDVGDVLVPPATFR